ncbi:MAG: hypothetical protein P8Y39_11905 [Nitrospirota bacterium]|jgi:hypothetical protein
MKNDEVRLLFETHIADIRYTKQQQWKTIYLTLIALAAIVSLSAFDLPYILRIYLTAVSPFVGALGICYIYNYHKDLSKYRAIKDHILEKRFRVSIDELFEEFPKGWEPQWKDKKNDLFEFVALFSILIVLATVITMMLLWV